MAGMISQLIEILDEQALYYEQLLALALEKKDVIIQNDVETLQKITTVENSLVGKNQRLERKRIGLIKDMAMVLNKKEDELGLTALAELMREQPEYDELTRVSDRLRKAVHQLKDENERNKLLIRNSLEYIDFTVNVYRSSMSNERSIYSATGEELNEGRGFFDTKQ